MMELNSNGEGGLINSSTPTYQTTLKSFSSSTINELKQTHAKLLCSGELEDTLIVGKLVADIAASHPSNLPSAHALFHSILPPLNVFIWNSMIHGYAHLGALGMGRWIHAFIKRNRMRMTLNLEMALINMYAKCGEIESARSLFERMPEKDMRTWSVMISNLAVHELAKESMGLFSVMQHAEVNPDSLTLTCVLSTCSHAGLVDEGLWILKWMNTYYHVESAIEHYGCIVELLERAGQLGEALSLIKASPVRPDVVI